MYHVDISQKKLTPINATSFAKLQLRERYDLQEWLISQPHALGEELLIIQKEYCGFEGTRERLDLLALDKTGNLVIIENKIDDSGKDVVWQALKYASYCSALTKKKVIEIYQEYLNEDTTQEKIEEIEHNAEQRINDFLIPAGSDANLADIEINDGNSQRIMLVATTFPKEVTNTVLWLNSQGLNIQCIQVTPHAYEGKVFVTINRIIPTPVEADYLIGIRAKETEKKISDSIRYEQTIRIRQEYWSLLLERFKNSQCSYFKNITPSKEHWISSSFGVSYCPLSLIFGSKLLRVSIDINRSKRFDNKFLFDELYKQKDVIEEKFGQQLEWSRLNENRPCRIQFEIPVDGYAKENWDMHMQWHLEYAEKLVLAIKEHLVHAEKTLKELNELGDI